MNTTTPLNFTDHSRDSSGMTYVYPVISRRAGGVSVGINLNPNNACNWRCIYCQVPDLVRGNAPMIDLAQLDRELRTLLEAIVHGDFLQQRVPQGARHFEDIAFSGNGEPTSAKAFPEAVRTVVQAMHDFGLTERVRLRLITNGSQMDKPEVLGAASIFSQYNGEIWFKLDAATASGMQRINDVSLNPQGVLERLKNCAGRCPTWVQTCVFALDGHPPQEDEITAWLTMLQAAAPLLAGVHIYGLARPSMQPEAPRLSPLHADWLENLAARVRAIGLATKVSP